MSSNQWVYDGAEICELVGCLLLYNLNNIIDPCNHSLYRENGLIIVSNCPPRKHYVIRKKLHWLFDKFGFKLDIQTNLKITDNLDITLNLYNSTMSPFRKNNQYPCYINIGSNYPRQISNVSLMALCLDYLLILLISTSLLKASTVLIWH